MQTTHTRGLLLRARRLFIRKLSIVACLTVTAGMMITNIKLQ